MKKLLAIGVAACAVGLAAPAFAGTVSGEVRNVNSDVGLDSTQYDLGYNTDVNVGLVGTVNVGAEAEFDDVIYNRSTYSANVSKKLNLGVADVSVGAELGMNNFDAVNVADAFWGVNAGVSRQVVGPVSAHAEIRHRDSDLLGREDRYGGGLDYALDSRTTVGVDYQINDTELGYFDGDSVGVSLKRVL